MALTDYAQKRAERVFVRAQSAVGVFEMPTARDAIKLRGAATMPATGSEFAPSEEVRDTPDTDQLLKRKKPPAEFSLTTYAKVPTVAGVLPQWDALARNSYGSSGFGVTVGAGTLTGKTLTVIVDGVPNPVPLTDGMTPAALAAAVDALPGVSARVEGSKVLISADDGAGQLKLSSNAGAELVVGGVEYRLLTDILERLLTMIHYSHNSADYYRDCIVSNLVVRADGTTEASLTFTGFLGNSTTVSQTTLAAAIAAHDGIAPVAFELAAPAIQVGPTADDVAWMTIDGEAFRVLTFDAETFQGTAIGGQFGTAPVAHDADAEVLPYIPGPDPDANDLIIGLTIGEFAVEGEAFRIINVDAMKDEQINPRIDEAFEVALTGYRRPLEGRLVGGTINAYQRRSILGLATWSEREKQGPASLRLGKATGPRIVLDWPRFRLGRVEKGETAGEFTRAFPFSGLASGTPGNDGVAMTVYSA